MFRLLSEVLKHRFGALRTMIIGMIEYAVLSFLILRLICFLSVWVNGPCSKLHSVLIQAKTFPISVISEALATAWMSAKLRITERNVLRLTMSAIQKKNMLFLAEFSRMSRTFSEVKQ